MRDLVGDSQGDGAGRHSYSKLWLDQFHPAAAGSKQQRAHHGGDPFHPHMDSNLESYLDSIPNANFLGDADGDF